MVINPPAIQETGGIGPGDRRRCLHRRRGYRFQAGSDPQGLRYHVQQDDPETKNPVQHDGEWLVGFEENLKQIQRNLEASGVQEDP